MRLERRGLVLEDLEVRDGEERNVGAMTVCL